MSAPLYESLRRFSDSEPLRLHMPGHKGRLEGAFGGFADLDVTELAPIGNLYTGEGAITAAEALYAEAAGAREALFFSCGSTQGIYTMLAAAVGPGGTLILDRGCHKSVTHGMALLDITPVYLTPAPLPGLPLPSPVTPELLLPALEAHPEARAVLLTCPSYYGVAADLRPLSALCHERGVFLLVDQAHGAHFPWVGLSSAAEQGADLAVVSAHKTLPALGSSSVLLVGETAPWSRTALKERSALFATTSPSWPILSSIDLAREALEGEAGRRYRAMAEAVGDLRRRINRETAFHALTEQDVPVLDPCRLTVDTLRGGLRGEEADRLLQRENIFVEMSDERYLVAILTCGDRQEDLSRFLSALKRLPRGECPEVPPLSPPPLPERVLSIREALFGPSERLPLGASAGRIAAQIIAPYPPGIPVLAPGEEISQIHIAYLRKKSYNIEREICVRAKSRDS